MSLTIELKNKTSKTHVRPSPFPPSNVSTLISNPFQKNPNIPIIKNPNKM